MATTRILDTMARLDDAAAVIALLAPMRDGKALKRKLRPGFCGHKYSYNRYTRTACYLHTDGEVVACYSITAVSLEQASMIAARCDEMTVWSTAAFRAAVERALGVQLERLH